MTKWGVEISLSLTPESFYRMHHLYRSSLLLAWTGAASIVLLSGTAQATSFAPSTPDSAQVNDPARTEFDFMIECDPLYAEGIGSGPGSLIQGSQARSLHSRSENRLGLRPPKCVVQGTKDGGTFECECADGKKTDGPLSAKDALAMHESIGDGFEWCEQKVEAVCGTLTPPVESICENEHGVCAITAYSRTPDQTFSDLEQTCECFDDRTWLASTPTISSFELDQKTLDKTCQTEVARCAPDKAKEQGDSVIELPKETLSYPMALGCMDEHGICRVYSDKNKFWTNCECLSEDDGSFGVEAPWPLDNIKDMLETCREEMKDCAPSQDSDSEPEPEDEPEDDADAEKDSDAEPGCPDKGQGAWPKGGNAEPKPDVLGDGCSMNNRGKGALLALLALPGLGLRTRRRRRSS